MPLKILCIQENICQLIVNPSQANFLCMHITFTSILIYNDDDDDDDDNDDDDEDDDDDDDTSII